MENNNTNYDYATPQFAESYTGSNEDFDYFEEVDLDSIEFEADGLSEMDALRIEIDDELEQTLQEMEELEKDLEEGQAGKLADAIKENVMSTIKGQFGIIYATVGDVNVTRPEDAKKKEYAHVEDVYHVGDYAKATSDTQCWDTVRGNFKADKQNKEDGSYTNAYTTEAEHLYDVEVDHGVSRNQYHNEGGYMFQYEKPDESVKGIKKAYAKFMHEVLPAEQKAKFGTDTDNLKITSGGINSAKGAKSDEEFMKWGDKPNEKDKTKTNFEYYDIDKNKVKQAYQQGNEVKEKYLPNTGQQTAFYADQFLKHELKPMGKKVAKSTLSSLFGQIFSDFAIAIIDEIKTTFRERGQGKTWTEIFNRFKERMKAVLKNIQVKWRDIVKNMRDAGATTALSHILGYIARVGRGVLKSFAGLLVKWLHVIVAGFKSIVKAVKVLINPPPGMSKEEVHFAAAKVFVTGLIGTVSLGFSATIDTFLKANVPFLNVPPLSLISDAISSTIAVFIGGVLSTVVIYGLDKFHARNQKDKLQIQLVNKSGQVVQLRVAQAWFAVSDAYGGVIKVAKTLEAANHKFIETVTESHEMIVNTKKEMADISAQTWKELDEGWDF